MKRIVCLIGLLFTITSRVEAAQICVTGASPAGGCDSTVSTFALAITGAAYGDTIFLHAGTTYTGVFTLPNKGAGSTFITITSDTPEANLPPYGSRIDPTYAQFMPKIVSSGGGSPSVTIAAAAHHWRFLGVDFPAVPGGYASMILIGSPTEEFNTNEPTDITIDRCYFHGSSVFGQKRGIETNGKRLIIINNYFEKITGLGQDAAAIASNNGQGPLQIENNYIEASTENMIWGGGDPYEQTVMTVSCSPAPTTTGATVTVTGTGHNFTQIAVGDLIAVSVAGNTDRQFATLVSKPGSGTTGAITYTAYPGPKALTLTPDCGNGDMRSGVVMTDVTIRRNHVRKDPAWRNPILDTPIGASATSNTSAGTLPAGTYYYRIQAVNTGGYQGATIQGTAAAEVSASLSATGQVVVTWNSVPNVSHYYIWGRTAGSQNMRWTVTTGTTTYTDDGTTGTLASIPAGSKWQVKTLLEFKAARNVQVDSNVFENNWNTYAVWLKSVNQDGGCTYCGSKGIVLEKNIFRHINGWILAHTEQGQNNVSLNPPPLENVQVSDNLVYDSGSNWVDSNFGTAYALHLVGLFVNFYMDHNTVIHDRGGVNQCDIADQKANGLTITNSMLRRETFGLFSSNGEGTIALTSCTNGYNVTKNAIAGITASNYPAGNFAPTVNEWEASFANYSFSGANTTAGPVDYSLTTTSPFHNASSDGKDLGADIPSILSATSGVTSGSISSYTPVSITTASLPNAIQGSAYSQPVSATGVAPLKWSLASGSLPSGLSLNGSTGVISGIPTAAGTSNFVVHVADSSRGPQATITCPVGSVNISTAADIQSIVNANPGAMTFCLAAGVHSINAGITPKTGNTFIGAYGAIIDGTGWSMPPDENYGAFMAHNQDIDDVTIKNLVIRNMPKRAIHFFYTGADRWTVEYCELTLNKTAIVVGNYATVRHNYIHHNFGTTPTIGDTSGGGGYESNNTDGGIFEDNEFSYNGANQKFVWSRNLVFRDNWVHHNYGNGVWYDGENLDALIEGNVIEDNPGEGIFYEVSGVAVIRNNQIRRNGISGIFISTSKDTEVYGNVLEENFRGIQFNVDGARVGLGGEATPGVIFDLSNNNVHDNYVRVGTRSGSLANTFFYQNLDSAGLLPYSNGTKGNAFFHNQYVVPDTTASTWDWADSVKTWTQWQALGQDVTGSVTQTPTGLVSPIGDRSVDEQALSITTISTPGGVAWTTTSPLTAGMVGIPYSKTLVVSGDVPPYTFALTAGTLPAGLTLNTATGVISGTPITAGVSTFTIRVTGSLSTIASRNFSLTIGPDTTLRRPKRKGPIPQEIALFASTTPPDPSEECCKLGDEWTDISTTPAVKKQLVSTSPMTWAPISGGTSQNHNILSATHTDTTVATAVDGDMLISLAGKWTRFPKGGPGTFIGSDGTTVGWQIPPGGGGNVSATGNSLGFDMHLGTNDANQLFLKTSNTDRARVTSQGDTLFLTNNGSDLVFRLQTFDQVDTFSFGVSTGNGRKATLSSQQGTLQQALVFSDASTSSEYIFGLGSSQNTGSSWNRWFGVRQDGMVNASYLTLDSIALYTCDAAHRGQFNYIAGGTGVKDIVQICAKDAANAYAWRTVY